MQVNLPSMRSMAPSNRGKWLVVALVSAATIAALLAQKFRLFADPGLPIVPTSLEDR